MNAKPQSRPARRRIFCAAASGAVLVALAACGGGSGYGGGGVSNSTPLMPVITTAPANQTATAGQSVTFSVVASGMSPLSYQWIRGTNDIPGATNVTYTLVATAADNGATFSVRVTNTYGSVTSSSATLTVQ